MLGSRKDTSYNFEKETAFLNEYTEVLSFIESSGLTHSNSSYKYFKVNFELKVRFFELCQ